jgi:8-oxo-dGTP diphosphatase
MIHAVVAAMIIESQKILLGQRAPTRTFYPNVWDVFGGHIEPGEHEHQTLVRELQEELDITPTKWRHVEMLVDFVLERNEEVQCHLYLVLAWTGTPVNRQLHEHTSIQWFSLAQAMQLELAHPAYPQLFARILTVDPPA